MKLKNSTGRPYFWQWDLNQKLIVEDDCTCKEVHFCNRASKTSLVCLIEEVDGERFANVPNILLQTDGVITAYLCSRTDDGGETRLSRTFQVRPRTKPETYVYTETEVLTYHSLADRIDQIEQNGVFDERIGEAVETYFEENPDKIPSVNADWLATKEFVSSDTVYIPEQKISSGLWNKLQANLQVGSRYEVTLNGEVYTCTAVWYDDGIILGNNPAITLNDYPFCVHWAGGSATSGLFFKRNDISYPLTLKVTDLAEYVYNKMPEEYLPDSVASVSTAGVGQVLAVKEVDVNGKPTAWKAVDMPTGGGAVKTVNGKAPDENGNVEVDIPEGGTVTDEQIAEAVEDYFEEHPVAGGGGGMSSTAINLLIKILKSAQYAEDQTANILALETALKTGDSGEVEQPESGVEQIGNILSIVSGVTVTRVGDVLVIE